MAGISPDYYLRLEQGRETHPSTRVLEGLVHALSLGDQEAAHLFSLGRPPISPHDRQPSSAVDPGLQALIESLWEVPVHVLDSHLNMVYVNDLASELSPHFRRGNNLVRLTFAQERMHDQYWQLSTQRVVAFLRASVNPHDDSPQLHELVRDLSEQYPRFVELWDRHDVMTASGFPVSFSTPRTGTLELRFHAFVLPRTGGLMMGLYAPAPGGPSEAALQLLNMLRQPQQTSPPRPSDLPASPMNH